MWGFPLAAAIPKLKRPREQWAFGQLCTAILTDSSQNRLDSGEDWSIVLRSMSNRRQSLISTQIVQIAFISLVDHAVESNLEWFGMSL
eukprot:15365704-Ditylum_brightwellii.AAC.2